MTTIVCPALRNDDTLGFLAAVGLLELSTTALGLHAHLGWDGVGGAAILHADIDDLEDLISQLHHLAENLHADDRVTPAPWADLIPPRQTRAGRDAAALETRPPVDTMRMTPGAVADHYRRCAEEEADGDHNSGRWLAALVSQLATDDKAARLNPLLPRANQMTTHQQYRLFIAAVASSPDFLREALTEWRRYPRPGDPPATRNTGTGAYLDTRALHDATTTGHGQPQNTSVPGATWLALMSLPLFPHAGEGPGGTVGWTTGKAGPTFRWPVWTRPLDLWAVTALIALPQIARPDLTAAAAAEMRAFGVIARCSSSRRRLPKQAGVLSQPAVQALTQTVTAN
jgi:hypothetical protein